MRGQGWGGNTPNPLETGMRFNFLSLLDMFSVADKYMGVGDGEGKTRPHPAPLPSLIIPLYLSSIFYEILSYCMPYCI